MWSHLNNSISIRNKIWQILLPEPLAAPAISKALHKIRQIPSPPPLMRDLMPDPLTIPGMEKSIARMIHAIANQETIGIFGDYDVDGASSIALIWHYLQKIKCPANIFIIPCRLTEGYGPKNKHFDRFKERNVSLVLMVDCGTASVETIAYAKTHCQIDVIVLDHHTPPSTSLPEFCVNPHQDQGSSLLMLCAAGVCFLFLVALQRELKKLRESADFPNLMYFTGFVALATICDIVPITGLNRAFVLQGLNHFSGHFIGLTLLAEMFPGFSETSIGFTMGPLLNAGSRMGQHTLATQLLTTDSTLVAKEIAATLTTLNQERKNSVREALNNVHSQTNKESLHIVVESKSWTPGITGLIASQIADKLHAPTFAISTQISPAKGAARNPIESIHLAHILQKAKAQNILIDGGGHKAAAGFTISHEKIPAFQDFLEQSAPYTKRKATLTIDGVLPEDSLPNIYEHLLSLQPFGHLNSYPTFLVPNILNRTIKSRSNKHISFFVQHFQSTIPCITFAPPDAPIYKLIESNIPLHAAATFNIFQGSISLLIEDALPLPNV